ncbi:probable LRR receptor-like serine/threonine-protein kinase At1g53430 [Pistacia vera]|uniref:probable LRR receptor-like serine/threonine-protein kinase At1g53430 n=1 Tax=Pistacia vera TaxID=55513 RepID=UPI001262CA90|nr:probable LRR receptor-like serine/threonine-protein kinase At1g53430 [Pistacia vera]
MISLIRVQYHSLFINAGGEGANIGGKYYDADNISSNSFYVDPTKRWAYVCSGDFLSTTANSSDNIRNNTCGVSSPEATLYDKARICPQSLTYYGFCLQKGNYTVELDFAEIVFSKDEDYSSLGKRVFDVYIQVMLLFFLEMPFQ